MVYTDGVHVISDVSLEELHEFCRSVGINRCWFDANPDHPHYDIPKRRRGKDLPGAKRCSSKELVRIIRCSSRK